MIIIVFGLPGSGKSYFASRLANELSAGYINSDVERKKMLSKKTYSAEEKLLIYEKMLQIMKAAIKDNKDLVLDATFYQRDIREKFISEAGNVPMIFIEVFANLAITSERLSRKRTDSDADIDVYYKIKKEWEPLVAEHLLLESTNDNIRDMITKAIDYIKEKQL